MSSKRMTSKLTVEQVQASVRRFWKALSANDAQTLADFYLSDASVFNATGGYPEPGPRDAVGSYFGFDSSMKVELTQFEVRLLGKHAEAAVASYKLRFYQEPAPELAAGVEHADEEDTLIPVEYGRVSQIFAMGPGGNLRIVHEHISLPAEANCKLVAGESWLDYINIPA
jgi:ketosteroid isomerase-like protein